MQKNRFKKIKYSKNETISNISKNGLHLWAIALAKSFIWVKKSFFVCSIQFYFDPNFLFCKGYSAWMDFIFANIQYFSHFFSIWCFLKLSFAQNKYNVLVELLLVCFVEFYFSTHTVESKTENSPHRYEVRKFRTTVELQ